MELMEETWRPLEKLRAAVTLELSERKDTGRPGKREVATAELNMVARDSRCKMTMDLSRAAVGREDQKMLFVSGQRLPDQQRRRQRRPGGKVWVEA